MKRHILAASLGAVTPFCSCSAVPLFIGFVKAGLVIYLMLSQPNRSLACCRCCRWRLCLRNPRKLLGHK
ncbi:permease [Thermosynechococcus sp. QKsg1]|uniref:permease n=1 Tax=Thermosynechococcus sp. QKsg1 TaxID=3074130 RepID=UPI0037DD9CEF